MQHHNPTTPQPHNPDPQKMTRLKEAWTRELAYLRSLDPKARASHLARALKWCRHRALFSRQERERMKQDREYLKKMALEALWRKVLYLDHHPEEA